MADTKDYTYGRPAEALSSELVEGGLPLSTPLPGAMGANGQTLKTALEGQGVQVNTLGISDSISASDLPQDDPLYEPKVSDKDYFAGAGAADADSFLGGQQFNIDDFSSERDATIRTSVRSVQSNLSMSAKTAALSGPEVAKENYTQVGVELEDSPISPTVEKVVGGVITDTMKSAENTLSTIVTNPDISDEEKIKAIKATQVLDMSKYSINTAIMNEAIISDSEGETLEQEFVRVSLADVVPEINEVKRQQQQLLNMQIAKNNQPIQDVMFDIMDLYAPYVEQSHYAQLGLESGTESNVLKSFAFMGSTKGQWKETLLKMPPEGRMDMANYLVKLVNGMDSIALMDNNDYARVDSLRILLDDGYYTDGDATIDNIASVLDIVFLGSAARFMRGGKMAEKVAMETATRDAGRQSVRSRVQPTTVSQMYKDTNPAKAVKLHEEVAKDTTGELAEAVYGTTRTEAIANDLMPEVATNTGAVKNKVTIPQPTKELEETVSTEGAIYYSESEKASARSKVTRDFESNTAINNRKEMNQIESMPDGVKVKAVYGPAQGGHSDPQHAIDLIKTSLRDYGITDDQITLLRRDGDSYVPSTLAEVNAMKTVEQTAGKQVMKAPTDFLVQVDHNYKFNPNDVTKWEAASVKNNYFDRVAAFTGKMKGSLARHLLDPASMLESRVVLGANVAVDKSAGLEKMMLKDATKFSDAFTKLGKDRQAVLDGYIKEANAKGIGYDSVALEAQGFSKAERQVIKDWRSYWDNMYWLENRDLAKTLSSNGYKMFIDEASQTQLFARPMSRQSVGSVQRVYDQTTGKIRTANVDEITQVYKEGGHFATLREPMHVGDDVAEIVVARNVAGGSYTRTIKESDQVLNYREGYFNVHYTDPKFIEKVVTDANGKELYRKAVATAGNTRDAELMAKQMGLQDGAQYNVRSDVRKGNTADAFAEGVDVLSARGRTAQRARGERLAEPNAMDDLSAANILDPVSSMITSARSTSQRVATRNYLEATKSRFADQFEHLLPKDKWGRVQFPANIDQITKRGKEFDKDIADARTTFEYINYLEKGYINSMDDSLKAMLNSMAETFGRHGATKAEETALKLAEGPGITSLGKGLVFNLYLATNPLRQLVVQSHQAVQLLAFNPSYMAKQAAGDMALLIFRRTGVEPTDIMLKAVGRSRQEFDQMAKAYDKSGLSASIDKNSLLSGSLSDLVENSAIKKNKYGVISEAVTVARKVGFDTGEEMNIMSAWLAHRDKLIKSGMKVDEALDDLATGQARNFTYNMNRAGDMPYNQNSLAMLFQFMQVPHKAMTTWTTNRSISKMDKAKLLTFNTVMYSLPPAAMYKTFGDLLPEDPEVRDAVVMGLEPYIINKLTSLSTGTNTRVDYSALSPLDIHGTMDFVTGLFTTDIGTMVASSPAGQLFFGNNPRLTEAAKTWASYFNTTTDTNFAEAMKASASTMSGLSNAFKAKYAMEYGQKMSVSGKITDPMVTKPEAFAQLFGFQTMDEAQRQWIGQEQYEKSKAFSDDVKTYYKELKRSLARQGMSNKDRDFAVTSLNKAFLVFGNDNPKAREIILREIEKDVANGDDMLFQSALEHAQWPNANSTRTMIENIPAEQWGKKEDMLKALNYIDSYKE